MDITIAAFLLQQHRPRKKLVLQGLGRATTTLHFSGEEEKPAQVSCALDGGGEQTGTSLQSNVYAGKTTGIWGLRSPPEESSGPAI